MTCCSVFSTRCPTGARTRIRNWLSSVTGMNSVPIAGTSASDPTKIMMTDPIRTLRWDKTQESIC